MAAAALGLTVLGMDRSLALQALPAVYADVLRWRDAGLDDAAVAARLAIEPKSAALLVHVAEVKLIGLLAACAAAEPDATR